MKFLTILAISIGLLTASQAIEKPSFHTKGPPSSDCHVMKGIISCKYASQRLASRYMDSLAFVEVPAVWNIKPGLR